MKTILILTFSLFAFAVSTDTKIKVQKFDDFKKEYIDSASQDTIYLINFWATWCKPCVQELPFIEEVNGKIISEKPVKTILVSLDHYTSLKSRVKPFVEAKKLKSELILLKDGSSNSWIDQLDSSWSGSIPATLFIKNGEQHFHEGMYRSAKHIEREIKKL